MAMMTAAWDGHVELTWVAGYILRDGLPTSRQSLMQVLIELGVD